MSVWRQPVMSYYNHTHTHTQPFNRLTAQVNRVGRYQKKHSPTHTHPDHWTSFINFLHLWRSIASSVFSLRAWQSSLTTFHQVFFGLRLGLGPCTGPWATITKSDVISLVVRRVCELVTCVYVVVCVIISSPPLKRLDLLLRSRTRRPLYDILSLVLYDWHWTVVLAASDQALCESVGVTNVRPLKSHAPLCILGRVACEFLKLTLQWS